MANIQWKCKTPHANCEAQDWKHYKNTTESDAVEFMATKAPNSRMFDYRIVPEDDSKPASQ